VCCIVLQCLAVSCSMLQCFASCCSTHHWLHVVQCVAIYSSALQRVAVCCSVLQCVARKIIHVKSSSVCYVDCDAVFVFAVYSFEWIIHCNTLQHMNRTLQHTATHCNTLQHTATHCNTLQHAVFVFAVNYFE